MKKIGILTSILALTALVSTSAFADDCKPAAEVKTVTPGKLTVGVDNYPPFSIITPENEASGIDVLIARAVAKQNCLEFDPVNLAPAATIQAVISGKTDIAVGAWYRSEERSKVLGLSAPTYVDPMTVISKDGVDTLDGMMGKKVGTVTGYVWNADLQKLLGDNFKTYPDAQTLQQDLEANRIDIGLDGNSGPVEAQKAGRLKGFKLMIVKPDDRVGSSAAAPQSALLYTKDNTSLGQAIDAAIASMRKDGSLVKAVKDVGYDPAILDVGEPRLVK